MDTVRKQPREIVAGDRIDLFGYGFGEAVGEVKGYPILPQSEGWTGEGARAKWRGYARIQIRVIGGPDDGELVTLKVTTQPVSGLPVIVGEGVAG